MTSQPYKLTCDQVLESFAMEPDADGQTLLRYLRDYPEYAKQLIDLSQEIFRFGILDETPLSVEDKVRIDTACSRIQSGLSNATVDPFVALSVSKLREIAQTLDVPRQVITAFRERTVIVASVPKYFLTRFAGLLGNSFQEFLATLALPPQQLVRNYKADGKPTQAIQVTFEQLLRDAGLSEEKIKSLLTDDN